MTRLFASACLICTVLAACNGPNYQRGIGFTGIDGEPRAEASQDSDTVSRAVGPVEALAAHPPQRLRVATGDPAEMAAIAIAHGGQGAADSIPATLGGAPVRLSMVEVNGLLHAVMRLPEGRRGKLAAGSGPAFSAAVPRLTGCVTAGPAYLRERPAASAGAAVPVDCR
ncbi:hypothetical protein [Aquicoccus sp. SU-CL01552]|uniref:hypothetical protein n=1 Tax=Aquicoccus sp. SU-CL01552 TaxID=3127656 RepID=UPI0031065A2E